MAELNPRKTSLLPKTWQVPPVFLKRLGQSAGRQRLMKEQGHLLVILHRVPGAEDKGKREGCFFWVGEDGSWKSSPEAGGRSALRVLVEEYLQRARGLDEMLERSGEAEQIHSIIDEAAPILRASRNMLVVMQELREALPDDDQVLGIRDLAIDVERSMDLLLQDAKSSLDFLIAKSSAEQATAAAGATEEARKLNRLAAFFFPLMTLASVFGMNRPTEVMGYPGVYVVCALGLVMGAVVWKILRK